jgi:hypothetical protein
VVLIAQLPVRRTPHASTSSSATHRTTTVRPASPAWSTTIINHTAAAGGMTLHHGSNVLPLPTIWLATYSSAVLHRYPTRIAHSGWSTPTADAPATNAPIAST